MPLIAIDRMEVRYRVPGAAASAVDRYKRVVADVLAQELERAVERAGIGVRGHLCIRKMHAIAKLRMSDSAEVLASGISGSIVEAMRAAMSGRSDAAIYFASTAAVLSDIATRALVGDFDRSWAWAQMGLWPTDSPMNANAASSCVMRTLTREACYAAPVLSQLARRQPIAFAALLKNTTPAIWIDLVRKAGAASAMTLDVNATQADLAGISESGIAATAADSIAHRIVSASAIARVIGKEARTLPTGTVIAIAVLVVMEVEPAVMRAGFAGSQMMLAAVARKMLSDNSNIAYSIPNARPTHPNAIEGASLPTSERDTASQSSTALDESKQIEDPSKQLDGEGSNNRVDEADEHHLHDDRRRGATNYGGLLYAINLVNRIDLIEKILSDHRLTERGPRWALNRIACALARIEASDPAALAFAGLPPDAEPPGLRGGCPSESEEAATEEYRAEILSALQGLLRPNDVTEAALADCVFKRRAEIVADPGWIEAHFKIEDVSVEIRRARLDLNPDWLPWLGVVMRFVYA